jgi:hypothetical protein
MMSEIKPGYYWSSDGSDIIKIFEYNNFLVWGYHGSSTIQGVSKAHYELLKPLSLLELILWELE